MNISPYVEDPEINTYIETRISALPQNLQKAIADQAAFAEIRIAAQQNGLDPDILEKVLYEVMLVLMRLTRLENFTDTLVVEYLIPIETAENLSNTIWNNILTVPAQLLLDVPLDNTVEINAPQTQQPLETQEKFEPIESIVETAKPPEATLEIPQEPVVQTSPMPKAKPVPVLQPVIPDLPDTVTEAEPIVIPSPIVEQPVAPKPAVVPPPTPAPPFAPVTPTPKPLEAVPVSEAEIRERLHLKPDSVVQREHENAIEEEHATPLAVSRTMASDIEAAKHPTEPQIGYGGKEKTKETPQSPVPRFSKPLTNTPAYKKE